MGPGMPNRRGDKRAAPPLVSGEDLELWRRVTSSARPLRDRPAPAATAAEPSAPGAKRGVARLPRPQPVPTAPRRAGPLLEPGPGPAPAPGHAHVPGIDRRQAQRLKRGQTAIEARLDLHGHSQAQAHRELTAFLARAQDSGKRCVLVVTGRGVGKGPGVAGGGVLKREVPRWLGQPPLRARVLAFDIAQPRHGGDGALYVLLRRRSGG